MQVLIGASLSDSHLVAGSAVWYRMSCLGKDTLQRGWLKHNNRVQSALVGVSEAKPLSSGWCKTRRLGMYVTEVVVPRGSTPYMVGCLLLRTARP